MSDHGVLPLPLHAPLESHADALLNPLDGVGGEADLPAGVEQRDGAVHAHDPFLHELLERQAAAHELAGHGGRQAQVGQNQHSPGRLRALQRSHQLLHGDARGRRPLEQRSLHLPPQLQLLFGRQALELVHGVHAGPDVLGIPLAQHDVKRGALSRRRSRRARQHQARLLRQQAQEDHQRHPGRERRHLRVARACAGKLCDNKGRPPRKSALSPRRASSASSEGTGKSKCGTCAATLPLSSRVELRYVRSRTRILPHHYSKLYDKSVELRNARERGKPNRRAAQGSGRPAAAAAPIDGRASRLRTVLQSLAGVASSR
eukprot:scaffold1948_cov244-Pinguiococcus_pyrenoidosus.AAC.5